MSSGFKYKGTDLNDMIGTVSISQNTANSQFIRDTSANTTTTLSQYFNPLTNNSGTVPSQSIARLYNPTLYNINSQDISNSVIASYTDCNVGQSVVSRPSWANSCSVFIIGPGGGGAGGSQGFQKQSGQTKDSQNGRGGGGGGGGGIVYLSGIPINSASAINVNIGAGASSASYDQPGYSGGFTYFNINNGGQQVCAISAFGGGGGTLGSSNGGSPGVGGAGGTFQIQTSLSGATGAIGQNGQQGNPQQIFNYVNGGAISSAFYGNKIPYQIVSNGGSGQQQTTVQGQFSNFSNSLGYGAGGSGGAAGTSNGPGPNGSQGGAGAPGFIRIYWLNTA